MGGDLDNYCPGCDEQIPASATTCACGWHFDGQPGLAELAVPTPL